MTEAETVLVTGGTGFVGAYLARTLIDRGYNVVVFDTATGTDLLERLGVADAVRIVRGDVTDTEVLASVIRETGATRLIHLAALLSEDVRTDEIAATRVNAVGANIVLEVARSEQIDRVVLASSETVYGPESTYDGPVAEDALLLPDSTYSSAKRHAECLAWTYRRQHNIPVVILRPTGIFGPFRQDFTEFAELFEKPALGESVYVRGGNTAVSWLSVKDAADAFRRAAFAPSIALAHHVYNVRGEVATVAMAADAVREIVNDGTVEVADDEDFDWSAQRLSLSRARADLGYAVTHDLSALARDYVNEIRRDAGLSQIG